MAKLTDDVRLKNLKPATTTEEAKKRGRAGGIKSGEVKRKRKQARECMEMILSSKVTGEKSKQALKAMGFKGKDQQNIALLMASLFQKGVKSGDAATIRSILEIAGELNQEQETQAPQINIQVSAATVEDIDEEE